MDLFRDGADENDDAEDFQAAIPMIYPDEPGLGDEEGEEEDEEPGDGADDDDRRVDDDRYDPIRDAIGYFDPNMRGLDEEDENGDAIPAGPGIPLPEELEMHHNANNNNQHDDIPAIDDDEDDEEEEDDLVTIKPQLLSHDPQPGGVINLNAGALLFNEQCNKEESIRFKIHRISGFHYGGGELSSSSASSASRHASLRRKSSHDSLDRKNDYQQFIVLSLSKPTIVTKLNFDEKFLEKVAFMTVRQSYSSGSGGGGGSGLSGYPHNLQGGSSNSAGHLHHHHQLSISQKVTNSLRMFWYLMRTVKFYGGLTEDCPLELTATYSDITVCPPLVNVPGQPSTSASSMDNVQKSSAFSRVLRQFELSHTISGQEFPCMYLKLALPNHGSLLTMSTSSGQGGFPMAGIYHSYPSSLYYPVMFNPRGAHGHSFPTTSQSSLNAANAQKQQQVFQAKAWRLFVRVLTYQDKNYHASLKYSSLDSGQFLDVIGIAEKERVCEAHEWFAEYSRKESIRLTLKYFRAHNMKSSYAAIEEETGIKLEDPRMTELYRLFVVEGDYEATEKFLNKAKNDGLFEHYIRTRTEYKPEWKLLTGGSAGFRSSFTMFRNLYSHPGVPIQPLPPAPAYPRMRAGHSMVIDPEEQLIYLYGGFDGTVELDDLWRFDIRASKWEELNKTINTPYSRSCQQMCLDVKTKRIYMLGRYVDYEQANDFRSPLHMYDIKTGDWSVLQEDTYLENGPQLLCDHQMCIDSDNATLYVFGGLIQSNESRTSELSDFYSYDIQYDEWRLLRFDFSLMPQMWKPIFNNSTYARVFGQFGAGYGEKTFTSRAGHAMVFHQKERKLYIIGGHRLKTYFRDVLVYDVETDKMETLSDVVLCFPPDYFLNGCTIRANIDLKTSEIFIFTIVTMNCSNDDQTLGGVNGGPRFPDPNNNGNNNNINGLDFNAGPVAQANADSMFPIRTRSRFAIKNRLWTLDLKHRSLTCCYRNEKCYNGDGTVCHARECCDLDMQDELIFQFDEDDYLLCNYLHEPALHLNMNLLAGLDDPLPPPVPPAPAIADAVGLAPVGGLNRGLANFNNNLNQLNQMNNMNNNINGVNIPIAQQPNQPSFMNMNFALVDQGLGIGGPGPAPMHPRNNNNGGGGGGGGVGHNMLRSAFSTVPPNSSSSSSTNLARAAQMSVECTGKHRPRPRYATQIVFNPASRSHYLFGGNQNRFFTHRCDDFWVCNMNRMKPSELLSPIIRMVRRQHYLDLISQDKSIEALIYLRTSLTPIYNKERKKEKAELNKLIHLLFEESPSGSPTVRKIQCQQHVSKQEAGASTSSGSGGGSAIPSTSSSKATSNPIDIPASVLEPQPSTSSGITGSSKAIEKPRPQPPPPQSEDTNNARVRMLSMTRSKVYDALMTYFPDDMTQPKEYLDELMFSSVKGIRLPR